jgi:glycosyltransferase involved in cell wall biosynthesis
MLREELFKRAFSSIDAFICPSHFAMSRFLDWGIPGDVTVLENGHRQEPPRTPATLGAAQKRFRIGFFGSFTPFKGIDVVIKAAQLLRKEHVDVEIAVHGVLTNLDSETQHRFHKTVHALGPVLRYYGPYAMGTATTLMAQCDWILVPSIWWENSPVVLEEALQAGCPIIASDIGGMREKVTEGRDGIGFRAGDPYDLAQKIKTLASDPSITARYRTRLRTVKSLQDAALEHYQFYVGISS